MKSSSYILAFLFFQPILTWGDKVYTPSPLRQENTIPKRFIIEFKSQSNAQLKNSKKDFERKLSLLLGRKIKRLRTSNPRFEKIEASFGPTDLSKEQLSFFIKNIKLNNSNILNMEEDILIPPVIIPNDTFYIHQWSLHDLTSGLNFEPLWDMATGQQINIAILDTGYTFHDDLPIDISTGGYDFISSPNISRDGDGRDNDPFDPGDSDPDNLCHGRLTSTWHGTKVSGIIAAQSNNHQGLTGIAYDANIIPIRVLGTCGGYASDIADGIRWAAGLTVENVPDNPTPAKIINLSLGGESECPSYLQTAISEAMNEGALIITAAGNNQKDVNTFTPANCDGVLTVGASNKAGDIAAYSNYGDGIDLMAPGGEISTQTPRGGIVTPTINEEAESAQTYTYVFSQGTSFAAPHVSATAALMLEINPSLSPEEIKNGLIQSTSPMVIPCDQCGAGLLNPENAISYAQALLETESDDIDNQTQPNSPPQPLITPLIRNIVSDPLSGSAGNHHYFSFELTEKVKSLSIKMSGFGDADLYVEQDALPTTTQFLCRPYIKGSNESCTMNQATPGMYYIRVNGFDDYSRVQLLAQYEPYPQYQSIENQTPTTISGKKSESQFYLFELPDGVEQYSVQLSGGQGDADLYVQFGSAPTDRDYDCRPYLSGNRERCQEFEPTPGLYYIRVKGYNDYENVQLTVTF